MCNTRESEVGVMMRKVILRVVSKSLMLEFTEQDQLVKDTGDTNGGGWGYKCMGKYM